MVAQHALAMAAMRRECEAEGVEEVRKHALEREELLAALVAAAESLCTLTAESEVPAHFPDERFHFIARGLGDKVDPGQ